MSFSFLFTLLKTITLLSLVNIQINRLNVWHFVMYGIFIFLNVSSQSLNRDNIDRQIFDKSFKIEEI